MVCRRNATRTPMQHHSALPDDHPDSPTPVRDDTYYLSDGSCVLLVGRTLFNVRLVSLPWPSQTFMTAAGPPNGLIQRSSLFLCHVSLPFGRTGGRGLLR
jgi:hypothetical protein